MKKMYLFAALMLLLAGCEKESGGKEPHIPPIVFNDFTRSYVMIFEEAVGIKIYDADIKNDGECRMQVLVRNDQDRIYRFDDTVAVKKTRYDELCRAVTDMDYNRTVTHKDGSWFYGHRFVSNRWTKIDLVSDRDYDAAHPAGTSLADILWVSTCTPLPYINSGYKEKYAGWSEIISNDPMSILYKQHDELYPVSGWASELGADELTLIGDGCDGLLCVVSLRKAPDTKPSTHVFTLTMSDADGNVFTATKTVEYPK